MSTIEQPGASAHPASGCPVAHDFDPFDGLPADFLDLARKERPVFYHQKLDAYFVTR